MRIDGIPLHSHVSGVLEHHPLIQRIQSPYPTWGHWASWNILRTPDFENEDDLGGPASVEHFGDCASGATASEVEVLACSVGRHALAPSTGPGPEHLAPMELEVIALEPVDESHR